MVSHKRGFSSVLLKRYRCDENPLPFPALFANQKRAPLPTPPQPTTMYSKYFSLSICCCCVICGCFCWLSALMDEVSSLIKIEHLTHQSCHFVKRLIFLIRVLSSLLRLYSELFFWFVRVRSSGVTLWIDHESFLCWSVSSVADWST